MNRVIVGCLIMKVTCMSIPEGGIALMSDGSILDRARSDLPARTSTSSLMLPGQPKVGAGLNEKNRKYLNSVRPTKCSGAKLGEPLPDSIKRASIATSGGCVVAQSQTSREVRAEKAEKPKLILRRAPALPLVGETRTRARLRLAGRTTVIDPSNAHNGRANRANRVNLKNLDGMGIGSGGRRLATTRANRGNPRACSVAAMRQESGPPHLGRQ